MSDLYITSHDDWTPELIEKAYREIEKIATEEMDLGPELLYPNQIEIVSAEQMVDAYASIGLPVNYNHWSFGKQFLRDMKGYDQGRMGLALELIINSTPCIAYCMEDNTMLEQAMVMAHACIGHNAVYKNNQCFKQWTSAGSIIDYMVFARNYIRMCEERYGELEVEAVIDSAHAISLHGVDKYERKHKPRLSEEARLQKLIKLEEDRQKELDIIMKRTSFNEVDLSEFDKEDEEEQEENILYYIMKKAPNLPQWKREIIRIIYKVNQYFYPQQHAQKVHEGMASFCHYYIMTRLEEKGMISSDGYMAFLASHSGVINQPTYDKKHYSGFNPYAIGFAIMMDIKRICEKPTAEDKEWFPELIGKRWQDAIKEAAFEHRDDSFIAQYLSPKVIRDLKIFSINVSHDRVVKPAYVTEIHDDVGYKNIRNTFAQTVERINRVPQIVVEGANLKGNRMLRLRYVPYKGRKLDEADTKSVIHHIEKLWGYTTGIIDSDDEWTEEELGLQD